VKWRNLQGPHLERAELLRQQTPHQILGVEEGVTEAELKRAYRAKVMAYHPDRLDPFLRTQAEDVLKVINAAYATVLAGCRR
jgi:DnaJ-class molecular chaperone